MNLIFAKQTNHELAKKSEKHDHKHERSEKLRVLGCFYEFLEV
jgi:hypothetical protein